MPHPSSSPTDGQEDDGVNLRLVWPQWQGGGTSSVETFASEFPLDVARRGYAVGSMSSKRSCRHTTVPPQPCR